MSALTLRAAVYAVVEGTRKRYGLADPVTGLRPVDTVRVVRVVQGYPTRLGPNQVVVRLTLAVPATIFDPLVPTALVTIPEDLIDRAPIEVEALDAHRDEVSS